ncbi:hypothetical protein NEOLI_000495 [Neolecta irregularis DAH-3]|uniref:Uncharacterized protein n=1 Tax=Neolecta irregularis (strain DAH-3) TaxID=1198029 RepID=A0A1U7LTZ4_NEOID|nr:hypothetical protein NEOLI_000495 [Neolecta irregularis DAH-3]|eukprot:OLL26088.1 hypothetical protein NEOLI_000495 [Neolecta irregularis DAH-3]
MPEEDNKTLGEFLQLNHSNVCPAIGVYVADTLGWQVTALDEKTRKDPSGTPSNDLSESVDPAAPGERKAKPKTAAGSRTPGDRLS